MGRASLIVQSLSQPALEYRLCAQTIHNAGDRSRQRSFNRAATGALVAAPAKIFGHARNIHALASQTHSKTSIRQLTEEDRYLHISYGQRVIDQSLAIFLARAKPLHLFLRHPDPGQGALAV